MLNINQSKYFHLLLVTTPSIISVPDKTFQSVCDAVFLAEKNSLRTEKEYVDMVEIPDVSLLIREEKVEDDYLIN